MKSEPTEAQHRSGPSLRLALDHLTVVDASPRMLVETARAVGCSSVCLFMEPMDIFPSMPQFNLYQDRQARRDLRRAMDDEEVEFDLAYPFTLSGRTQVGDFDTAFECAADLGARLINVLVYDRNADRRVDNFARFCARAAEFDLRVALEFYPVSQIRTLSDAVQMIAAVDRPGQVGVNADLLHLMRSGGTFAEVAAMDSETILYGQFCDGPLEHPSDLDLEAATGRLLAGQGEFDIAGFAAVLPSACPVSVEIPRTLGATLGLPLRERAARAVASVRQALLGDALK